MGNPEGSFSGMALSGYRLHPQPSLGEKRRQVHEIAQRPDATAILSSWTRKDLLEVICAEMGKERKYSGYNKNQMIEHLLKLVSKQKNIDPIPTGPGSKRQRTQEQLSQAPVQIHQEETGILLCENLACRAIMSQGDPFCKRCSCSLCHHYDDNKDPSLWLTCDGESCGMTCHLKCALQHERAGLLKNGHHADLDGELYCLSCGKVNDLMRTWRKQLLVAKEARRVDVLCLRVSLSRKIIRETKEYKELLDIVESCVETLENEVGPLDQAAEKMDRRIVNRLSCGAQVQKLCSKSVEIFDSMSPNPRSSYVDQQALLTCRIRITESSPDSVIIVFEYDDHQFENFLGWRLWHKKSTTKEYPEETSSVVLMPGKAVKLTRLDPSTEYSCKVSFFSNTNTLGPWEAKWVTPVSSGQPVSKSNDKPGERENLLIAAAPPRSDSANSGKKKVDFSDYFGKFGSLNSINGFKDFAVPILPLANKDNSSASPTLNPPSTPFIADQMPCPSEKNQIKDSEFEISVKAIRELELEGHLSKDFRLKFLPWFSFKATEQEKRVVNVFVDTLIDDPSSLAEQLIDAFTDKICP